VIDQQSKIMELLVKEVKDLREALPKWIDCIGCSLFHGQYLFFFFFCFGRLFSFVLFFEILYLLFLFIWILESSILCFEPSQFLIFSFFLLLPPPTFHHQPTAPPPRLTPRPIYSRL
jgi:hypothetical protein